MGTVIESIRLSLLSLLEDHICNIASANNSTTNHDLKKCPAKKECYLWKPTADTETVKNRKLCNNVNKARTHAVRSSRNSNKFNKTIKMVYLT